MSTDPLNTKPEEDSGSETMARFNFQIVLTAFACLPLLWDETYDSVVCELHEDYVVRGRNTDELVSVKHLEPSRGAWTLHSICEIGGLKHLFDRWKKAGKNPTCKLQTNGGLKAGKDQAAAIKKACEGQDIDRIATLLKSQLGADNLEETKSFLKVLHIQAELPKREDLLAKIYEDELPKICKQLGWPPNEARQRFRVVLQVAHQAAASDIKSESRSLGTPNDRIGLARAIEKKTINRKKLQDALNQENIAIPESRLSKKLSHGGFLPTAIERAKRLRAGWLDQNQQWDTGLPGPSETDSIRAEVQSLAEKAEELTATDDAKKYGRAMKAQFCDLASNSGLDLLGEPLTLNLLLGAAYDETDLCNIWWSKRFDPTKYSEQY